MIFINPWAWMQRRRQIKEEAPKEREEKIIECFSFETLDGSLGVDFAKDDLISIIGKEETPQSKTIKYQGREWLLVMKWYQREDGSKFMIRSFKNGDWR